MARIVWEGIPKQYWPSTDKPWRVTSGIGQFQDFATQDEAQRYYEGLLQRGVELVDPPFNAVEA